MKSINFSNGPVLHYVYSSCRFPRCSAGGGQGAEPERPGGGGRHLLRVLRGGQPRSLQGHLATQRKYYRLITSRNCMCAYISWCKEEGWIYISEDLYLFVLLYTTFMNNLNSKIFAIQIFALFKNTPLSTQRIE